MNKPTLTSQRVGWFVFLVATATILSAEWDVFSATKLAEEKIRQMERVQLEPLQSLDHQLRQASKKCERLELQELKRQWLVQNMLDKTRSLADFPITTGRQIFWHGYARDGWAIFDLRNNQGIEWDNQDSPFLTEHHLGVRYYLFLPKTPAGHHRLQIGISQHASDECDLSDPKQPQVPEPDDTQKMLFDLAGGQKYEITISIEPEKSHPSPNRKHRSVFRPVAAKLTIVDSDGRTNVERTFEIKNRPEKAEFFFPRSTLPPPQIPNLIPLESTVEQSVESFFWLYFEGARKQLLHTSLSLESEGDYQIDPIQLAGNYRNFLDLRRTGFDERVKSDMESPTAGPPMISFMKPKSASEHNGLYQFDFHRFDRPVSILETIDSHGNVIPNPATTTARFNVELYKKIYATSNVWDFPIDEGDEFVYWGHWFDDEPLPAFLNGNEIGFRFFIYLPKGDHRLVFQIEQKERTRQRPQEGASSSVQQFSPNAKPLRWKLQQDSVYEIRFRISSDRMTEEVAYNPARMVHDANKAILEIRSADGIVQVDHTYWLNCQGSALKAPFKRGDLWTPQLAEFPIVFKRHDELMDTDRNSEIAELLLYPTERYFPLPFRKGKPHEAVFLNLKIQSSQR